MCSVMVNRPQLVPLSIVKGGGYILTTFRYDRPEFLSWNSVTRLTTSFFDNILFGAAPRQSFHYALCILCSRCKLINRDELANADIYRMSMWGLSARSWQYSLQSYIPIINDRHTLTLIFVRQVKMMWSCIWL